MANTNVEKMMEMNHEDPTHQWKRIPGTYQNCFKIISELKKNDPERQTKCCNNTGNVSRRSEKPMETNSTHASHHNMAAKVVDI
jgi:hypothetical protein